MNYARIDVPKRFPLSGKEIAKLEDNESLDDVLGMPGASWDLYWWFKQKAPGILKSCHALNAYLDRLEQREPLEEWDPYALETEARDLSGNSSSIDCCWCSDASSIGSDIAGIDIESIPQKVREAVELCLALSADGLSLYRKVLKDINEALPKAEAKEKERQRQEQQQQDLELAQEQQQRELELAQQREQHIKRQRELLETRQLNWDFSKPSHQHQSHKRHEKGVIYILQNQIMPGIYKIGFTTDTPEHRASEITREMKMPVPFEVAYSQETVKPFEVEQAIHKELKALCQGREFFTGELDYFKQCVDKHLIQGVAS